MIVHLITKNMKNILDIKSSTNLNQKSILDFLLEMSKLLIKI